MYDVYATWLQDEWWVCGSYPEKEAQDVANEFNRRVGRKMYFIKKREQVSMGSALW